MGVSGATRGGGSGLQPLRRPRGSSRFPVLAVTATRLPARPVFGCGVGVAVTPADRRRVRRLLRHRLPAARQRLPRAAHRRGDRPGGAARLRRQSWFTFLEASLPAEAGTPSSTLAAPRALSPTPSATPSARRRRCSTRPGELAPRGGGRNGDDRRASQRTSISATARTTSSSSARRSTTCSTSAATFESIRRLGRPRKGRVFVDVLDVEFMMLRRGLDRGCGQDRPPRSSLTRATALAYFEQTGLRADRRAPVGRRPSRVPARARRACRARLARPPGSPPKRFSSACGACAQADEIARRRARPRRLAAGPRKNLAEVGGETLVRRALDEGARSGLLRDGRALHRGRRDRGRGDRPGRGGARPSGGVATDDALAVDVVLHALATLEQEQGDSTPVAVVQATSPFHLAGRPRGGPSRCSPRTGSASVVSVVKVEAGLHPLKLKLLEGDRLVPVPRGGRAPRRRSSCPSSGCGTARSTSAAATCSTRVACSTKATCART